MSPTWVPGARHRWTVFDPATLHNAPVVVDVDLAAVLKNCSETVCLRYHLPLETVQMDVKPAVVRAQPIDIEMVFRNLIDNASTE